MAKTQEHLSPSSPGYMKVKARRRKKTQAGDAFVQMSQTGTMGKSAAKMREKRNAEIEASIGAMLKKRKSGSK